MSGAEVSPGQHRHAKSNTHHNSVTDERLRDIIHGLHNVHPIRDMIEFGVGATRAGVEDEGLEVVLKAKCHLHRGDCEHG